MGLPARALFLISAAALVLPAAAAAQPIILAFPTPPANERGWTNSAAKVEFLCGRGVQCPDNVYVDREGGGQVVEASARGEGNTTASAAVSLNIDWTGPLVAIQSPRATITAAASITVVATSTDSISGVRNATCNGRPAAIGNDGVIRCDVPLVVGPNDVVVEVADQADNSGSAGFRIVRTSSSTQLSIVPEVVGMIVGQVTTVQVHDVSGRPARGVAWFVDNPSAGEMSADGRHVFTAKAPGTVTITAATGSARAKAVITVYGGDRLPMGSTRWKIGSLHVMQTPDTQPLKLNPKNVVATRQNPGEPIIVESINGSSGWLNWREHPAATNSETPAAIRELADGGAVVVVDSHETGRSALLRSTGTPWRYQSIGDIRPAMVVTANGELLVMERTPDGFTRLVVLDAATGRVTLRQPLLSGAHAAFNIRCVQGAHGVRHVPAQIGPLNPETRQAVHFGMVLTADTEDFAVCGQVNGTFKRTVMIATLGEGPARVDTVATIEVPASSAAPVLELFEVTIDRRGAKLLPWARVTDTGAREFRVTRVADSGTEEFALPGAGKVWLSGRNDDLAVTTDGIHLVGFNVVTGAVVVSQAFERGVRIVGVDKGSVLYHSDGVLSAADIPNRAPR